MSFYLDTSLLVAAHTDEPRTKDVQAWLRPQTPKNLAISPWVVAEFSAALSKKLRTGEIDAAYRAKALAAFNVLIVDFVLIEVTATHFGMATAYVNHSALSLRAADALHLAIASEQGAALHTLDERLGAAGPALGIRTVLL